MSLHAPTSGRIVNHPTHGSTDADGANGAFIIPSPEPGWLLVLIVSDQDGWEHVSVHATTEHGGKKMRTPNWREMHFVKMQCWAAEDLVMQLHPPESQYINVHPHTLHLWRPLGALTIPAPPQVFV